MDTLKVEMSVETAAQVLFALYVWHDTYEEHKDCEDWWWPEDDAQRILAFMQTLESNPDVMAIVKAELEHKDPDR